MSTRHHEKLLKLIHTVNHKKLSKHSTTGAIEKGDDTMGMLPKGLIPGPEEIEKIKAGFKEFAREIDDIHEQVSNINEKVDKILEAIEKLKSENQVIDKKNE